MGTTGMDQDSTLEARVKAALDACHAAETAGDTPEAARLWREFVALVEPLLDDVEKRHACKRPKYAR